MGSVLLDCDADGVLDACRVNAAGGVNGIGGDLDCNNNGRIDACESAAAGGPGGLIDCDGNGAFDFCEINDSGGVNGVGGWRDANFNGVLDACQINAAGGVNGRGGPLDEDSDGRLDAFFSGDLSESSGRFTVLGTTFLNGSIVDSSQVTFLGSGGGSTGSGPVFATMDVRNNSLSEDDGSFTFSWEAVAQVSNESPGWRATTTLLTNEPITLDLTGDYRLFREENPSSSDPGQAVTGTQQYTISFSHMSPEHIGGQPNTSRVEEFYRFVPEYRFQSPLAANPPCGVLDRDGSGDIDMFDLLGYLGESGPGSPIGPGDLDGDGLYTAADVLVYLTLVLDDSVECFP